MAKHLVLDLKGCNPKVLNDPDFIRGLLHSMAKKDDIVAEAFHHINPQGVSGIIWTNGLHLHIHTWPEQGWAAVDILDYGEEAGGEALAQALIRKLEPTHTSVRRLKRSLPEGKDVKIEN